jgi:glucose/galactose transporter
LLLGGADGIKEKAVALAGQISALKLAAVADAAALASAEGERQALLDALAQRVVVPYIVIIVVLLVLAFFVLRSPLPEIDTARSNASAGGDTATGRDSVRRYPHLFLGVLCLFLYMGVEVMAGDAVSLYGKASGMPLEQTKFLTSYTLVAMVVGYIAGILAIPRWLKQENALGICAVLGAVFTAGAFVTSGVLSVAFVCLLGLANSLMWPAIFPLAIAGLGRFTNLGSAFLIMAIAGGALIPQFYAHSQEWFHIRAQTAFLICMLPCYAYILYYALLGHRAGRR